MIDITYPPVRKSFFTKEAPKYLPPPKNDNEMGSLFKEAQRRDKIIKALVKGINYVEGEIVTPYNQEGRDKWGEQLIVEKICDSYALYGKNEDWPKNDTPFLITCYNKDKAARFNCTPGYVIPWVEHKVKSL